MRLTTVISNIRGGGSTRSAVHWANGWAARGHKVTILAIQPGDGEGRDFELHPDIELVRIDLTDHPVASRFQALKRLLGCLLRLRRAISRTKPDLVVVFDGTINIRTLLSRAGTRTPVVAMEQVHPRFHPVGAFWERCRKLAYPRAAALLNLTRPASDWCEANFRLKRTAVIPNPVLPPPAPRAPAKRQGDRIIAAGRLVDQKRFDLLVRAFASIAQDHPGWTLTIYGEGPERPALEALIRELGIEGRVTLPGWELDLSARMAEADLFVLSSEYEGFGCVLCEAMATGLPAISFDCPSGPSGILRHEVDGLLVPPLNAPALSRAMARLMDDPELRARLGRRAPEVLERFSLERTLDLWDRVFAMVLPDKASGDPLQPPNEVQGHAR